MVLAGFGVGRFLGFAGRFGGGGVDGTSDACTGFGVNCVVSVTSTGIVCGWKPTIVKVTDWLVTGTASEQGVRQV